MRWRRAASAVAAGAMAESVRHELLPMGHVDSTMRVEDSSFEERYLDTLYRGILNITFRRGRRAAVQRHRFGDAFDGAYTFHLAAASQCGLAFAPDVLGLPLQPFLDRSLDSKCNAFFLNAVVLGAESPASPAPWHDFAVAVHADQSLRAYAANVAVPNDGVAETVVILYLTDIAGGGELEVYEHFQVAEEVHRLAERRAAKRCSRWRGVRRVRCQSLAVDSTIAEVTVGRVLPRKGRLIRFEGSRSHAVRRLNRSDALTLAKPPGLLRVSLVLEQFHYPQEALEQIPTVWSEHRGNPFFNTAALRRRFVDEIGKPRAWGGRLPAD